MAAVLEDALGVADVDRPVGLAAPLGADLREVDDREAPVEGADEGLGVAADELHRVPPASRTTCAAGSERTMPATS